MSIIVRSPRLAAAAIGLLLVGCDEATPVDGNVASSPGIGSPKDDEPPPEGPAAQIEAAENAPAAKPSVSEIAAAAVAGAGEISGSSGSGAESGGPEAEALDPVDGGTSRLPSLPTGTMATVGAVDIPMGKFRSIYDLKVKKYAERGREIPATADRRYRKSIAERLVYAEVLAQQAKSLGVTYDAAELAEREAQQRRGIKDWPKHLERRGETEESLRDLYVAELLEHAILEKRGALELTAAEITDDYDKIKDNWKSTEPRVRASHILVPIGPPGGGSTPASHTAAEEKAWQAAAKKEAERLHALAVAPGADFAELARKHSSGPSAIKGGDIGIFTADRMTEPFSKAAFKMKVGEISAPVQTKFGFHVIKLTGKWPAGALPQSALEDQIRDRLRQRKLHEGRRALKEELLKTARVIDHVAPTLTPTGAPE